MRKAENFAQGSRYFMPLSVTDLIPRCGQMANYYQQLTAGLACHRLLSWSLSVGLVKEIHQFLHHKFRKMAPGTKLMAISS